jgi:hypothetical protein
MPHSVGKPIPIRICVVVDESEDFRGARFRGDLAFAIREYGPGSDNV